MAEQTAKGADIPSTIQRSGKKAQETWSAAHDSAVDSYGEGERAHRTAFSALKHAARGNRSGDLSTAGGVDANASKKHLQDLARRLDVKGRSKMDKDELVEAIRKANDRETAKARRS
jgi:hypothetical protein